MIGIRLFCVLLLTSDFGLAQAALSTSASSDLASQVETLQQTISQMQKQLTAQQREIETLKGQSKTPAAMSVANESVLTRSEGTAAHATSSALRPQIITTAANIKQPATAQEAQEKPK